MPRNFPEQLEPFFGHASRCRDHNVVPNVRWPDHVACWVDKPGWNPPCLVKPCLRISTYGKNKSYPFDFPRIMPPHGPSVKSVRQQVWEISPLEYRVSDV